MKTKSESIRNGKERTVLEKPNNKVFAVVENPENIPSHKLVFSLNTFFRPLEVFECSVFQNFAVELMV